MQPRMKGLIGSSASALALIAVLPATAQQAPAASPTATVGAAAEATNETNTETTAVDTVVVTGTRTAGFRASDSPAPVQVLGSDALKRVGQPDLIQSLAQQVPSIQTQAWGGDQAAFHPSVKLRGLSSNHTLVLIDGKRRHPTASVNVAGGLFGGGAAPDISLIPEDAIERVEILQDGAAAQYGTDAIAGVLNIITKKAAHGGSINVVGGHYFDEGGKSWNVAGNVGTVPFEGAYFNLTAEQRFKDFSFRGDYDPRVVDTGFNTPANTGVNGGRYNIARFGTSLTGQDNYPFLNRIQGDGRFKITNVYFNAGSDLSSDLEIYSSGSYSRKQAWAKENYRLPTAIFGKEPLTGSTAATTALSSADIPFVSGFTPMQYTSEEDYSIQLGQRGTLAGLHWDISSTYGKNTQNLYVIDSANAALYYDTSTVTTPGYTPRETHNGNFIASRWTNTLDLSHEVDIGLYEPTSIAGGAEYRRELYQLRPGELASYYVGSGIAQGGVQSLFGYSPLNETSAGGNVFAQYLDFSSKITSSWLADVALRHEHYSDFGGANIFKFTSRYDFSQAVAVRGTVSTGFRAPTLPEGYFSGITTAPTSVTGTFAPNSPGATALGISGLKPEKSLNLSGGLVVKPGPDLLVTVDAYRIRIRDRIVRSSTFFGYSSAAATIVSPSVVDALRANGVPVDSVIAAIQSGSNGSVAVNAFVNGATSVTNGVDFLSTYNTDFGSYGRVSWSLAANYNDSQFTKINAPPANIDRRVTLLDAYAIADLTDTTPRYRATLGAYWSLGKFSVNLRENAYGRSNTIMATATNGSAQIPVEVKPSLITDLELGYEPLQAVRLSIGANNLFNKYPTSYSAAIRDAYLATGATLFTRKYPDFSPYGINGGYYYARALFRF
jgi:iron complex outermembrane recepter protein